MQCNKARTVTYSIKSGWKETGVVVQGRAKQGWPQKALERGIPTWIWWDLVSEIPPESAHFPLKNRNVEIHAATWHWSKLEIRGYTCLLNHDKQQAVVVPYASKSFISMQFPLRYSSHASRIYSTQSVKLAMGCPSDPESIKGRHPSAVLVTLLCALWGDSPRHGQWVAVTLH